MTATIDNPALQATPALHPIATVAPLPLHVEAVRRKALLRFAISISLLTLVGHLVLGFEQMPLVPLVTLPTAYVVNLVLETADAWAFRRPAGYRGGPRSLMYFLLPAHIAALACSMLIYADNLLPYVFATTLAVSSKYVLRIPVKGRMKHFLNPSNGGIAIALLLLPQVGFTPPYMFLNNTDGPVDVLIPIGVLMAGTMLNAKLTRKTPLILAWVGGYVLQAVVRAVFLGDNVIAALQMTTGVAFILFTNYMITDPSTTPVTRRGQIVFGFATAAVYGVLVSLGVSYAIFFALSLVCLGRGVTLAWTSVRHLLAHVQRQPTASTPDPVTPPRWQALGSEKA